MGKQQKQKKNLLKLNENLFQGIYILITIIIITFLVSLSFIFPPTVYSTEEEEENFFLLFCLNLTKR